MSRETEGRIQPLAVRELFVSCVGVHLPMTPRHRCAPKQFVTRKPDMNSSCLTSIAERLQRPFGNIQCHRCTLADPERDSGKRHPTEHWQEFGFVHVMSVELAVCIVSQDPVFLQHRLHSGSAFIVQSSWSPFIRV